MQFFAIPLFALLSDRIGRRPVYAFGGFGLAAWSFALFPDAGERRHRLDHLALVVGLVLHGAMYGPQAAFITELFPTRIRYSGVSIAYQLTSIFAGSLAPIIALWLYRETGSATAGGDLCRRELRDQRHLRRCWRGRRRAWSWRRSASRRRTQAISY